MIQYKIYHNTPIPPAWIIEALTKHSIIAGYTREDWCAKHISNLKEIANIEIDTGYMQEWFLVPMRMRCLK